MIVNLPAGEQTRKEVELVGCIIKSVLLQQRLEFCSRPLIVLWVFGIRQIEDDGAVWSLW